MDFPGYGENLFGKFVAGDVFSYHPCDTVLLQFSCHPSELSGPGGRAVSGSCSSGPERRRSAAWRPRLASLPSCHLALFFPESGDENYVVRRGPVSLWRAWGSGVLLLYAKTVGYVPQSLS